MSPKSQVKMILFVLMHYNLQWQHSSEQIWDLAYIEELFWGRCACKVCLDDHRHSWKTK